jgi:hypothetical protein
VTVTANTYATTRSRENQTEDSKIRALYELDVSEETLCAINEKQDSSVPLCDDIT